MRAARTFVLFSYMQNFGCSRAVAEFGVSTEVGEKALPKRKMMNPMRTWRRLRKLKLGNRIDWEEEGEN